MSESSPPPATRPRDGLLSRIGVLRAMLSIVVLACLPLVFFSGGGHAGWRVIPGLVAPVLVVILVWLLFFDLLMTRVFMGEHPPEERPRYRTVLWLDASLVLGLFVFWGPYYYALVAG